MKPIWDVKAANRSARLALAIVIACTGSAGAEHFGSTDIDQELSTGIDLRRDVFRSCFGQSACEVDGMRIAGERVNMNGLWEPAVLYWDPIDGFGVLGGGQDDEIDLGERLVIDFDQPEQITGIWLSDLFIKEKQHYNGIYTNSNKFSSSVSEGDRETAYIALFLENVMIASMTVTGDLEIPNTSFNSTIDDSVFDEGGDFHHRLTIREDVAYITFPAPLDEGNSGAQSGRLVSAPIGQLSDDVIALFADAAVRDTALLARYVEAASRQVVLFEEGRSNAERITALLRQEGETDRLRESAEIGRFLADPSNGEVSGVLSAPETVTRIVFEASADTSNDYSVAGVLLEPDLQSATLNVPERRQAN